jgi:membrane protease YdiL (CAAX protease family)
MASAIIQQQGGRFALRSRWGIAAFCLISGIACLAARWISSGLFTRVTYGSVVAAVLLAVALLARRSSAVALSSVAFAFFVFAMVQVLNNSMPLYVGTTILRRPPANGDPLGSTVSATIWVQLLETAIAVVPILVLVRWWGEGLAGLYLRVGRMGWWLVVSALVFVGCYLAAATGMTQRLFPVRSVLPFERFLALTPALLVLCLSNGLQEELLFRGLFLKRYQKIFRPLTANLLQATVFAIAHVGVVYTPIAFVFLFVVAFPLGLVAGYLMRNTQGMVVPVILHAGLDIPIYFAFLTYVIRP